METSRRLLLAKIHGATVTQADLNYEGSLTIPPDLLEISGIANYEAISVWNITRGSRLETYAIVGEPGSRDVCVNGAAAHLTKPGDKIIIAAFADVPESKIASHEPQLVFVDENNQVKEVREEIPGPRTPTNGNQPNAR